MRLLEAYFDGGGRDELAEKLRRRRWPAWPHLRRRRRADGESPTARCAPT